MSTRFDGNSTLETLFVYTGRMRELIVVFFRWPLVKSVFEKRLSFAMLFTVGLTRPPRSKALAHRRPNDSSRTARHVPFDCERKETSGGTRGRRQSSGSSADPAGSRRLFHLLVAFRERRRALPARLDNNWRLFDRFRSRFSLASRFKDRRCNCVKKKLNEKSDNPTRQVGSFPLGRLKAGHEL